MKTMSVVKAGLGGGAALLLVGFLAAPAARADGGGNTVPCSTSKLIKAITAANTAGGGVINLAPRCRYALTAPVGNGDGLPPVTTRIVVNGNGATIDGTGAVRVFEVDGPGGNLSLNNVRITRGSADIGGGIKNVAGRVTLNFSTVTRNKATQAGGGIASATLPGSSGVAKLTLNFSRVTGNSQTETPGTTPGTGGLGGGGILTILGVATLNHSQVSDNTAMGFVGGGIANGDYINTPPGSSSFLTLNNSRVTGNSAPNAGGGGIQNLAGTVTVNNSRVNDNTSLNGGGISSGNGNGGIPPGTSHLTLNRSQVNGNTATAPVPAPGSMSGPPIAAGGIANGGSAVLNGSQVSYNTASHTSGGGIVNHGTMTLINTWVTGNRAAGSGIVASGGGIISAQGEPGSPSTTLTLINSWVTFNRAGGDGGGIANGVPLPGPMPLIGGTLKLVNSLVIGNKAAAGGGIFNNLGTVALVHALIIGNRPDNCEPLGTIAGCRN
jgi:hypothetical protein